MNKQTEIQSLKNSIKANHDIIRVHPEREAEFTLKNAEMEKRIEELENPIKTHSKPIQMGEEVVDMGDNCLAIQKNGKACHCKRVYGNYCGKHIKHYVEEMQNER